MEKYERIRVVGRGAFGIVHLCLRKADQKLVIIKQIPVEQMTKEERQAAQNECQVLKLLNHPNVIEYYENFLEDKALMIAMEYAPGGTLAEFIQKRCNSLLEEETILHFFVQILLALHHVHTHLILHRDLKTQNILLDKHRMVVKIGDFGISKILSSKSKAYTGREIPGHWATHSPRQHREQDHQCPLQGRPPGTCTASHSTTSVIRVHMGRGAQCSSAAANAQHRGGSGGHRAHTEGWRHTLWAPHPVGGPTPRWRRGRPPSWGSGAAAAPVHLPFPGGPVRCDHQACGLRGPLHSLPDWLDWSIWKNSLISLPFLSSTPPSQDRGIIMTFGSGSNGCLGHGSLNDISQPTIVEALLGYEMVQVACGASHVLALSTERELFAWGRGDGGRLGLGTRESYNCPQQVPMPPGQEAQRVVCGIDSSMILTVPGRVLACGSNRFNKLGLDHLSLGEEPAPHQQVEEVLSFTPLCSAPLDQETLLSVDLGTAHSAAVTASGDCYTFGSNQHGQLGTNARRVSRAPCQVQGLQGIKIAMVACGDAFTVAIGAEGEVYSWGKGARGRLGRRDEDAGLPRPVQLDETHPYTVTSVSCCHGNTLLAVRLNALRAQLALSWKPDLTLGSRVVFRDLTGKGWRWVWLHPDPAPPPAWLENASLVPSGTAAQCFGAGQGGACLEGHSSGHSSGLACALPGAGRSGGAALTPPPTLCHSSETGWGKGNWLDQTSFQMTGSSANKNISCLPA
ncbi:serine/threonine-protein kinase Nek8 isoform X5 [Myotis lucifugus]|uniref:serine/threonine-protein kinase Nek8 isoform X5 n=1 Tax=Myotis lucifugus TaxID=59463 RepID=UPI000CCC756C|nr:serine/threonine-protein kinase Nek8 isoform X5 [Myotis lucifugus]